MTTSSSDAAVDTDPGQEVSSVPSAQLIAWRTFLEAHARTTELLAQELKETEGIALTWYDVLVQLSEADDHRLRMQELAERVLLSKSGLTRLIDRMERHQLVDRRACPSDRRGTFAELTPAGLAMLRRAAPTHLRGVREHFADLLDDDEAATLSELLGRIADGATTARVDGHRP
ncbi:MAG: MarR family transcriptional regulator [Intrasporangiaceae bacterium]|nr:MarR family transcriptional regulator [Intrasporangiaceae bacterium]